MTSGGMKPGTMTSGTKRRGGIGQGLVLGALAAIALLAFALQRAPWPQGAPATTRTIAAAASLIVYVVACALWLRAQRRRASGHADADHAQTAIAALVVHASQTGFAERIAELTAEGLRDGGLSPALQPLASLDAARLARASLALFVVSTTGEGDPPDTALAFVDDTMSATPSLAGLQYAVLALGDRRYARYCAFGHALDDWLRRCGAQPLFDLIDVDNGDGGALRRWQHDLAQLPGMAPAADRPDWSPAQYGAWRLCARRTLNPGSLGGATCELRLWPEAGELAWTAGDIAEIGPRHAAEAVDAWLQAHALDGNVRIHHDGDTLALHELLARSRWPDAASLADGIDAATLAARLEPLPHRDYSIASIPGEGHLRLLVRRMRTPEGHPGLGSGWLCEHAAIGEDIALRIRRNPGFHPPAFDAPLILIGNGTGLAGLRAHLAARAAAGAGRAWLLFGERQRSCDLYWADELDGWRNDGTLARIDLAFSRDEGQPHYVQDLLPTHGDALRAWIADGASVLVCGSAAGMAPAVDDALATLLGRDALADLQRQRRYRRDVY